MFLGKLVCDRIFRKSAYYPPGSNVPKNLPPNFTPDMVSKKLYPRLLPPILPSGRANLCLSVAGAKPEG